MKDVFLSSIFAQLHKSERIIFFGILFVSVSASMLFTSISAYEEKLSFDGDSSFSLINCSRISWHIDSSDGNLSPPSLRSGPIPSGGVSCVAKIIEGPAMINFFWKEDRNSPRVGTFLFNVDNETILQCPSSDWSRVDYAVPSGSHQLSWEYRKWRSYPEYEGAGWIDDLKIVYPKERMPDVLSKKDNCCDQLPSIIGILNRTSQDLSKLETRVGQIDLDIEDLSTIQTTLDRLGPKLNQSRLDERFNQLDIKIADVAGKVENLSFTEIHPCNLSWICENVVYITDKNINLTEEINKNKNKTIVLSDGVYHTGGLSITTSDIYIRSLRKGGVTLDADKARIGVIIDTVKNVTLDSVAITNCSEGVHIENSTNCNIINNLITDFNETGILSRSNSQCTFMLNRLNATGVNLSGFDISGRDNNNNTFIFNEVHINKCDHNSIQYCIKSPANDNYIAISDDGFIKEDDIYCEVWDNKFKCTWTNNSIANLTDKSVNMWSFLDWDAALINEME